MASRRGSACGAILIACMICDLAGGEFFRRQRCVCLLALRDLAIDTRRIACVLDLAAAPTWMCIEVGFLAALARRDPGKVWWAASAHGMASFFLTESGF